MTMGRPGTVHIHPRRRNAATGSLRFCAGMALAINAWTFLLFPQTAYPSKLVVAQTLDFNGFAPTIDSFNSTNDLYSTGGLYDSVKAQDHGDVTTLSGASNALAISNAKIKGTVRTGPGGTISIGTQGSVGDM